jgi:periplasmic protein TonB
MREEKMLMPRQDIVSLRPGGMTPNRAIAIGAVALLHVVAVYALMTGMTAQIAKLLPPDLQVAWVDTAPPKTVPVPPQPKLIDPVAPTVPTAPVPVIQTPNTDRSGINVTPSQTNPVPANSSATGISNTHSTPPYPVEARTLSHQGTVMLQITVSPQGDVVAANVVQSSGYAELDQSAVNWVLAHWKYRPAIVGGVAVTSQTEVAVKFDLKDAAR